MVISSTHQYLFIEVPLTASWAIRNELCKFYDGSVILHKHATYPDFLRYASDEEKQYFVFAAVRNPLDKVISGFYKFRTDHKGVFSDAESSIHSSLIDYTDMNAYKSIKNADLSFETYFMKKKIWDRPYTSMIDVSAANLDFILRLERLEDDFGELLDLLAIRQVRPVPVSNKTQGRKATWENYYTTSMVPRAKRKFGPFMKNWGYDFPQQWGEYEVPWVREAEYHLAVAMKKFYLTRFRYNKAAYSRFFRKLHAQLKKIAY